MLGDLEENPTGSGFGLHISKKLLEAMGGSELRVSSQMGQGTVFYFELQIADYNLNPDYLLNEPFSITCANFGSSDNLLINKVTSSIASVSRRRFSTLTSH